MILFAQVMDPGVPLPLNGLTKPVIKYLTKGAVQLVNLGFRNMKLPSLRGAVST